MEVLGEQMRSQSPACAVCLDLKPDLRPPTRWQCNAAENLLIESAVDFSFQDLEKSSQECSLCSVVKSGLETLSRGALGDQLSRLDDRKGSFIVQRNLPLEVEILGESDESSVRVQSFKEEGKGYQTLPKADDPN